MEFCEDCGSMMTDRGEPYCKNCGDHEKKDEGDRIGENEDIQRPRFRNCEECGEIMTEAGKHWHCKNCGHRAFKVEYR